MKQRIVQRAAAGLALVGVLLAAGGSALAVGPPPVDKSYRTLSQRLNSPAGQALAPVLVAAQPGQAGAVAGQIARWGGQVQKVLADVDFIIARVPGHRISELEASPSVIALGLDRRIHLDRTEMQLPPEVRELDPKDPGTSLKITTSETRAAAFRSMSGYDGQGVTIAILDTGVDPGHPDLQRTTEGLPKIVDWQDFSGEGDVALDQVRTQPIPGIRSVSGQFRMGVFKEEQIPQGEMRSDVNRDGDNKDQFGVLAADTQQAGVYDTVWVDTNANGDFTDEKPMKAFAVRQDWNFFGSNTPRPGHPEIIDGVNFAVTRIAADGTSANLGFDGALHGTHVAGIAAGNGRIVGAAPGAQIVAIKVLSSGGSGSWGGILQGMQYAAEKGAKVINMSLGGMSETNDGSDPQSILINALTERYGVLFSIAAGNSGPGLNTMAIPGVASEAITSGAYISPDTFRVDYGVEVPEEGLWYFTSQGPRDDGALKPNIVSPGTARSSTPAWFGMYQVFQGTSMSTPQTSGAAALLYGAAAAESVRVSPRQVRVALQDSARRLPGYGWAEQGYGLIQVDAAWERLKALSAGFTVPVRYRGHFDRDGKTLYRHTMVVENNGILNLPIDLQYTSGAGGLRVRGPRRISVAPKTSVKVPMYLSGTYAYGYYDALVTGRMALFNSPVIEYLVTTVKPLRLGWDNTLRNLKGSLGAARYKRYFIRVPEGSGEFTAKISTPQVSGQYAGRVRLIAFDPGGMPVGQTDYVGAPEGPGELELTVDRPKGGTWELVVYASHGAALYGVPVSQYRVDVAVRGVYANPGSIDLPWQPGARPVTRWIQFHNLLGEVKAGATGTALVKPEVQQHTVAANTVKDIFFTVPEGTALTRVALPLSMPAADVEMSVYYNHPEVGWVAVGSGEEAELLAPAPGQYAVELVVRDVPGGQATIGLELTNVTVGDGVKVQDQVRRRWLGTTWWAGATVQMPEQRGTYYGAVVVRDDDGQLLQVVPLRIRPAADATQP